MLWRPSLRRLSGCFERPPPVNSSLNRTRCCQRRFTRSSLFPSSSLLCASPRELAASRTRRAHSNRACVLGVFGELSRPARLPPCPTPSPPRAAGPWNLPARATSSRSTPRPAHCFGRPPPLAAARTAFGLPALHTLRAKPGAGSLRDSAVLRASWAATRRPPRLRDSPSVFANSPTCNQLLLGKLSTAVARACPGCPCPCPLPAPPVPAPLCCSEPRRARECAA